MDVLDAMIRDGISLARSVEVTAQWDEILRVGPVNPVAWEDFELAWSGNLGQCPRVVRDLHCRLSDFMHRVVIHRRDESIRGWRKHMYAWCRYTRGRFECAHGGRFESTHGRSGRRRVGGEGEQGGSSPVLLTKKSPR